MNENRLPTVDDKADGNVDDQDENLKRGAKDLSTGKKSDATGDGLSGGPVRTFSDVFDNFAEVMRSYRNFIPLTLGVVPNISKAIAERSIEGFGKENGKHRLDLSDKTRSVFEVDISRMREFTIRNDSVVAALKGAEMLPQVMIIGLVSAFDSFLGQLLRVVFEKHPQMILGATRDSEKDGESEKSIKLSELSSFKTIQDVLDSVLDKEVETILRKSHHDQFAAMEKLFKIPLNKDLDVWPKFIELCERRNLLTHTGGVVSAQYCSACEKHGFKVEGTKVGDVLSVNAKYFSDSVRVISEVGFKLCYVLWRKFEKEGRDAADEAFNFEAFELIGRREYKTAKAMLSFSTKVLEKNGNERIRLTMVINLANAMRLMKEKIECNNLLSGEDWSAVSDDFQISLAAIREDVKEVTALMRKIGKDGHPRIQDYRTWPIFRGMRTDPSFSSTFEEIFDEALFSPNAVASPTIVPKQIGGSSEPGK